LSCQEGRLHPACPLTRSPCLRQLPRQLLRRSPAAAPPLPALLARAPGPSLSPGAGLTRERVWPLSAKGKALSKLCLQKVLFTVNL